MKTAEQIIKELINEDICPACHNELSHESRSCKICQACGQSYGGCPES